MMIFKQVGKKNMYISKCGNVLKSYDKIIAVRKDGQIYLNADYYNYSTTTARHRNLFLGVNAKEFKENDKKGCYYYISDEEIMEIVH